MIPLAQIPRFTLTSPFLAFTWDFSAVPGLSASLSLMDFGFGLLVQRRERGMLFPLGTGFLLQPFDDRIAALNTHVISSVWC